MKWKINFFYKNYILKKINIILNKKINKLIFFKNSFISKIYYKKMFFLYKGYLYKKIIIIIFYIGKRFGNFVLTRKPFKFNKKQKKNFLKR